MRGSGIKAFGGSEALEALDLEAPVPGAGEALVRVAFAGVNAIDTHVRRGAYLGSDARQQAWPIVLGYEGAGTVEAVGAGVGRVKVGERVAWCGIAGAHAESALVPAWRLVRIPETMPLDVACALQLDGMLAHALAITVFPIRTGDMVLVQGAADPAAQLLVQIAKAQGATVIATVPREVESGGPRAAGADHILTLGSGNIAARVREITAGAGCHVVYDGLGRETIATSLACCRRRGVVAIFGAATGPVDSVRPDDLAQAGSIFLARPHLGDFMQDETETLWRMESLVEAWGRGTLKVQIGRILPLDAAREAHLAVEAGAASGKVVLKI